MRKISACHYTKCCHGNAFNPKIDNQNISLNLTVLILVNHYGENLKRNYNYVSFSNSRSIGRVFHNNSREPP